MYFVCTVARTGPYMRDCTRGKESGLGHQSGHLRICSNAYRTSPHNGVPSPLPAGVLSP